MTCSENDKGLTISGLADAANVGLGTIRYYQKIGLMDRPPKPKHGGFRRYYQKDIDRLKLIRNSQALGFSLKEIGEILKHREQSDCQSLRQLIGSRKTVIKNQIHELESSLERLIGLSSQCDGECSKNGNSNCRLIQSFVSEHYQLASA